MANLIFDRLASPRVVSIGGLIWVAIFCVVLASGCQRWKLMPASERLRPSNDRDWKPEQRSMPFAEIDGTRYSLRNIRNCTYLSTEDYVVEYYDRQIELSQIQSVDFIVVPFKKTPALAAHDAQFWTR